jgi:hypothetical protein
MRYPSLTRNTLGLVLVSSLTMACGGEEIDHGTIQQTLAMSLTNVSEAAVDSIQFLENSRLFDRAVDAMRGSDRCAPAPTNPPTYEDTPGSPDYFDDYSYDCSPPGEFTVDVDISPQRAEAIEMLNKHIFNAGNIETESRDEVTYLLRGSVVCTFEGMDADDRRECIRVVDNAQIRLQVTPAGEHNIDVSLMLGQNRINPVDFEFYRDHLGIEVDLLAVRSAITHMANVIGEGAPELPNTMEGRARLAIVKEGPQKVTAQAGILRDIRIADGDFQLSAARAERAFSVTADAATQTLSAALGLGAVSLQFKGNVYDDVYYDDYYDDDYAPRRPEEPTREPLLYGLKLAGASVEGVFEATRDILNFRNIGLGNETTTLDINNKRVFSIDLNASAGRKLDLTVNASGDDVEFTVSPMLDLRMVFELIKVRNELNDIADWLLDEVLTVKLDGADAPKVRTVGDGLKVLAGKLTLKAEKANITHVVETNMCLANERSSDDSDCAYDEYGNYDCGVYTPAHPFEEFAATTCG